MSFVSKNSDELSVEIETLNYDEHSKIKNIEELEFSHGNVHNTSNANNYSLNQLKKLLILLNTKRKTS